MIEAINRVLSVIIYKSVGDANVVFKGRPCKEEVSNTKFDLWLQWAVSLNDGGS